MSTSRHIDKICCIVIAFCLVLTLLFMHAAGTNAIPAASYSTGYEERLFDQSKVHTLNIVMDDWDSFLSTCTSEEYSSCSIVIDGEAYKNAGIRGKGNTSLTSVANYGNDRYSFKIEFDKYSEGNSYYGLDKLSLNNIIQDNTYMKDYLCYTLMNQMGVAAPLCSFVYITVNGEDWGLYLAVEGVEDGFLQRNYGSSYGNLYKPDSSSFGGGRGNGMNFDMEQFSAEDTAQSSDEGADSDMSQAPGGDMAFDAAQASDGGMGSDDVKLQYIDDDPDSYTNIFDNAKTDITSEDQERLIASLKKLSEGEDIESVVDTDMVIRYLVVHNFVCNGDSYTGSMVHNYYLYEKDGVLSMIPWDYNLAFGGFRGGMGSSDSDAASEVNSPIDSPVDGDLSSRPMVAWIFADETYTELYHTYYQQFISECFDSGYVEELIDSTASLIDSYVQNDPTAFCTYEEFQTGVAALKAFCQLRAQSIQGQLDGTIPSTEDGQAADASALIDASEISLSDMGTMNGGGMNSPGGDGMKPSGDGGIESTGGDGMKPSGDSGIESTGGDGMDSSGDGDMNSPGGDGMKPSGDGGIRPSGGDNGMGFSGGRNMDSPDEQFNDAVSVSDNPLLLLGLSFAVLLFGLIFAIRYRC